MIMFFRCVMSWIMTVLMLIGSWLGLIKTVDKDIVILYTNDVHCAVGDESSTACIGYAGLASYKNEVEKETPYVTLVDVGDAIQGKAIGTVSHGEYIVDIMNYVGYDYAAIGNHEFDYGMEQLGNLIDKADYSYLSCNITYSGTGENELSDVVDFGIEYYGLNSVAYIGVSTPFSTTSSKPVNFMDDNGKQVYGFSKDSFYSTIQKTVNKCKLLGADYVVILGHTGDGDAYYPYGASDIISNVSGIDVYLDAHDHIEVESKNVKDKKGENVILSSAGSDFSNFGKLTISANGDISTELISDYTSKDTDTQNFIKNIVNSYEADLNKVVGYNPIDLTIYENGVRKIRSREMPIGNLIADAYRSETGAQIAFVNGGGIRANLNKGDITYGDLIAVHPFGNKVVCVKATGQQILDALEMSYRYTESEYINGTTAVGESGGFFHVSGMKYTIDTSVPSSVVCDSSGNFISVDGARRVKNVQVLSDDGYVDIDPSATYSLAGNDFMLFSAGDGFNMFSGCEKICSDGTNDYEVLISYFLNHSEDFIIDNYSDSQNRINVL